MSLQTDYRPHKVREYGQPADIWARSMVEVRGGPKAVAARLGRSLSSVHGYADPNAPVRFTYDQVQTMVEAGARAPIDDLCNRAGGAFIRDGRVNGRLSDLMAKASTETAEAMSAAICALDGPELIPKPQALRLMSEAQDAVAAWLQIIACIASRMEQGE